jgi:hypothetical protein
MKQLLALITILFAIQLSSAQLFSREKVQNNQNLDKKSISWGYYFGINNLDFKFDYNNAGEDIETIKTTGFNVGLVGDVRLNDHLNFRLEPGLVITNRKLMYPESYFNNFNEELKDSDLIREVKSTYVYIPFLLRICTKRMNNIKPFITVGAATAINLSSNQDNPNDNSNGAFRSKKNVLFYDLGFGIDFYLYWFKFTPSIRGVFAFNDEIVNDTDPNSPWTGNVSNMKTRGVFLNFTFR